MPSSLISSSVICAGALKNAKHLNFPVLLYIGKSILHVSHKYGVEFKPKSSQISCLLIFSGKVPAYIFFIAIFRSDLWWCV